MIRKTQKQFTGLKAELTPSLPYGSQFIAIDTKELFVYDENGALTIFRRATQDVFRC